MSIELDLLKTSNITSKSLITLHVFENLIKFGMLKLAILLLSKSCASYVCLHKTVITQANFKFYHPSCKPACSCTTNYEKDVNSTK